MGKNAVSLQNSWLSDFGRFPVTSSSMTVKSKCVLHTTPVVLASIESVLTENELLKAILLCCKDTINSAPRYSQKHASMA